MDELQCRQNPKIVFKRKFQATAPISWAFQGLLLLFLRPLKYFRIRTCQNFVLQYHKIWAYLFTCFTEIWNILRIFDHFWTSSEQCTLHDHDSNSDIMTIDQWTYHVKSMPCHRYHGLLFPGFSESPLLRRNRKFRALSCIVIRHARSTVRATENERGVYEQ